MLTHTERNDAAVGKVFSQQGKDFLVGQFIEAGRGDIAEVLTRSRISNCSIYGINLVTEQYEGPPCLTLAISTSNQQDLDALEQNADFIEGFLAAIGYCVDWLTLGRFD